jgi:hypothetical protein
MKECRRYGHRVEKKSSRLRICCKTCSGSIKPGLKKIYQTVIEKQSAPPNAKNFPASPFIPHAHFFAGLFISGSVSGNAYSSDEKITF